MPPFTEKVVEKEKILVTLMILNADPGRYCEFDKKLVNRSNLGHDNYPKPMFVLAQ